MKGSIIEKSNNKYQLVVTIGSDYRGKPKRFYKTIKAKNKEDAKMKLAVFYNECEKGEIAFASGLTFKEFVEIWKRDYAQHQLKKSTYTTHLRNIEYNFKAFENKRLNQIKSKHIREWINYLHNERNLSAKTVRNNYSLLHSIFQKAVVWEYVDKNPADNIELPRLKRKEANYYTEEDLQKLLKLLEDLPIEKYDYKVGILLGLFGGLRRGEICGIDESDIDFENNLISIHQTRMVYGSGGLFVDTPKTEKSVRTIALPHKVIEDIKQLIDYHKSRRNIYELLGNINPALLKNECGTPLYPQSLLRWFTKFQKDNGLPHVSIHGLRHTHTAMLRNCDFRLEEVSKRLGHSQKSTTLNIYSHLFIDRDANVANVLGDKYFD